MSPKLHIWYAKQRGAGLPLAIFIITVLAVIVATITQLQQGTAEMEVQDIQSTRAFYAAESGAQAFLALLFPLTGTPLSTCPDLYSHTFTEEGLTSCSVDVTCSLQTLDSVTYFRLESVGTCGGGTNQASRRIEVTAR